MKKNDVKTEKTFLSPLELYEQAFCHECISSDWCKPNEQRMLICILCALLNKLTRNFEEQTQ